MEEIEDPACRENSPVEVKFEDIQNAMESIRSGVAVTPCVKSHLSDSTGMDLYIKKDFLQYSGSFKERGARFCLMQLSDEEKQAGVVAASAGNHAQALSYHGMQLGVPVTVVMPVNAPVMKIQKCKNYGANVIVTGNDMTEAKNIALKMAKERGVTYVNGYDHPNMLAGNGSLGIELFEQLSDVDAVIIPVGGAGLIAGVSAAVKGISPNTIVIGVESEKCPGFTKSLEAGKPTLTKCEPSLADGLNVALVGFNAFETAKKHIDRMVIVREEMIAVAILALVEQEKCVVEGAAATPLAAIFSGALNDLRGKRVVMLLSGGNIDTSVLGRCLERGLAVMGRLIKFRVHVTDRPGGLSGLIEKLSSAGVCIKEIIHERAWVYSNVFTVQVQVICEIRDILHALEVKELIENNFENADFADFPNVCTAKILAF